MWMLQVWTALTLLAYITAAPLTTYTYRYQETLYATSEPYYTTWTAGDLGSLYITSGTLTRGATPTATLSKTTVVTQ